MNIAFQQDDLMRQVLSHATAAFMEWLSEGWIAAETDWRVDRSRIQLARDWYGPYWVVTFTMEHPPWFGDSVTVEVEELPEQRFRTSIDSPRFAGENIACSHKEEGFPEGHWEVNLKPRPSWSEPSEEMDSFVSLHPKGPGSGREAETPAPAVLLDQRPREVGWADSRHWMEEEL
jgi:hypothetical protein